MAINSAKVRRFNLDKVDLSSNSRVKPQKKVSSNRSKSKVNSQTNVSSNQPKVNQQTNVSSNQPNVKVNPQTNASSNQSNARLPKDYIDSLRISCTWGNAKKKKLWGLLDEEVFIDLDLNCVMLDDRNQLLDYILSPSYGNINFFSSSSNNNQVFKGKLSSDDGAINHTGDAYGGKGAKETITADLTTVHPQISKIFFFINIYNNPCGNDKEVYDFSEISSIQIETTENALSTIAPKRTKSKALKNKNCKNNYALILGYLRKVGNTWKYEKINKLYDDLSYIITIRRICNMQNI